MFSYDCYFLKVSFLWIQFGDEYTTGINMYVVHIPDAEVVLSASEDVVVVSEPSEKKKKIINQASHCPQLNFS